MIEEKVNCRCEGEQSQARTSRRVQSEQDPELGRVRRRGGESRPGDQKARKVKGRQKDCVSSWSI